MIDSYCIEINWLKLSPGHSNQVVLDGNTGLPRVRPLILVYVKVTNSFSHTFQMGGAQVLPESLKTQLATR